MALRTFVKINSVNNLTDARYCAGMYVDLIGFELSPKAHKTISPQTFQEITGWLSGVEFVAEFDQEPLGEVLDVLADYEVNWVEHAQLETLIALRAKGYQCIYRQDITHVKSVNAELGKALQAHEILLHLTSKNEKLAERELEIIQTLSANCQVLLGSGITSENVHHLLDTYPLKGIALHAGDEIKPGLKDFDELADILEGIELED